MQKKRNSFLKKVLTAVLVLQLFFCSGNLNFLYETFAQAAAVNCISNSDFEEGLEGYEYAIGIDGFTVETVTDEVQSGSKALHIKMTGTAAGAPMFWQEITVEPNTSYEWTFWARTVSAYNKNAMVGVRSADGTNLLPSTVSGTNIGDCFAGDKLTFDSKRTASDWSNWHQGLKTLTSNHNWYEYTVTFDTSEETTVLLTFNPYYDGREFWIDNMSLDKVVLANSDFEKGIEGYEYAAVDGFTVETVTDEVQSGSKALHIKMTGGAVGTPMFWQEVTVEANATYQWKFWAKTSNQKNTMVGVCTADGTNLLPSTVSGTNVADCFDNTKFTFDSERSASDWSNWHQGLKSLTWKHAWNEYTVTFSTLEETTVLLTFNPYAADREFWIDNMSLKRVVFVNSDFEDGLEGYEYATDVDGFTVETVTDCVFSGENALHIKMIGTAAGAPMFWQEVTVEPNTTYEWTFWAMTSNQKNAMVGVRTADGTNLLPSTVSGTNVSDCFDSSTIAFESKRAVTPWSNWHQGLKSLAWKHAWNEYTVTFETLEESTVLLTFNPYYDGREFWIDDMSLNKVIRKKITNGGFEYGVIGYEFEGASKINAVADPDDSTNKVLFVESGGSKAEIAQKVAVTPYTEYVWSFDFKNTDDTLNGMYVKGIGDKNRLLPSIFESSDGGYIENSSAVLTGVRDYDGSIHYGANNTEWKQYTVRFYSAGYNVITLNMDFCGTGYTDNWSLTKNTSDWGDTNGDGQINALDLTNMRKGILQNGSDYSLKSLDMNVDGDIDIRDLVSMKKQTIADLSLEDGYELVWYDDFKGTELNANKWTLYPHMSGKDDLVLLSDERAVNVENDSVTLSAGKLNNNKFYANTSLTTSETMIFKYGYVEMKAKIPTGRAAFPSFWMKSSEYNRSNPELMSEIDVFEVFGTSPGTLASNCHKWYSDGTNNHYDLESPYSSLLTKINKSYYTFESVAAAAQWHTFGLLWTPEKLVFSVDGIEYMSVNISVDADSSNWNKWYYDYGGLGDGLAHHHDYHYLIMNNYLYTENGMHSSSGYAATGEEIYTDYVIDYVRIYQKSNEGDLIILE